jgi:hypothetical protein
MCSGTHTDSALEHTQTLPHRHCLPQDDVVMIPPRPRIAEAIMGLAHHICEQRIMIK